MENEVIVSKGIIFTKGDENLPSKLKVLSNTMEFDGSIKKVYSCSAEVIYIVDKENWIYSYDDCQKPLCLINDKVDCLPIPYSDEMLIVREDNDLISLKTGQILRSFSNLPDITISINSRYGENETVKITNHYCKVLTFLSNHMELKSVHICADFIMNKWLIISSDLSKVYEFDTITLEAKEINLSCESLNKAVICNIIFFKNAVYYPLDGKICSLNIFNSNYLEFECDKITKESKIEIVKDGFRLISKDAIYDLVR